MDDKKIKLIPMTYELMHRIYRNLTHDRAVFADNFFEYEYDENKVNEKYNKEINDKTLKEFAICMEGESIPIGFLKLKYIDLEKQECSLGIHLTNDSFKNKGYGTIAEKLALSYAFNVMGMKAVNADAILKNKRSQHVMQKVGFKYIREDDKFKYYRCEAKDF